MAMREVGGDLGEKLSSYFDCSRAMSSFAKSKESLELGKGNGNRRGRRGA
jgi:hypothetical protein